jgi:hypothetical protein
MSAETAGAATFVQVWSMPHQQSHRGPRIFVDGSFIPSWHHRFVGTCGPERMPLYTRFAAIVEVATECMSAPGGQAA